MSVIPVGMGSSGGYEIPYSLRFRASNSAYLSRTVSSSGNRKMWTLSLWLKRGGMAAGTIYTLIGTNYYPSAGGTATGINITDGQLGWSDYSTTYQYRRDPANLLRDPSAWYHLVFVFDSDNATAADRAIIYINGSRVTAFTASVDPALSYQTYWNAASSTAVSGGTVGDSVIGAVNLVGIGGIQRFHDGLLSEVNFIDGAAKQPTDFGEYNSDGVWVAKKYTGTYNTNGFYLDFKDGNLTSGSNAGLGKDVSGNGNYWNTNGISVTAGVTYDWMYDTPTNNYAVLNPNSTYAAGSITLSEANLKFTSAVTWRSIFGTIAVSSGKWYFEVVAGINSGSGAYIGIIGTDQNQSGGGGGASGTIFCTTGFTKGYGYSGYDGNKQNNGTNAAYGATYGDTDVIGVALDLDNNAIYFAKQTAGSGAFTWQNSGVPTSGASRTGAAYNITAGEYVPAIACMSGGYIRGANFGQRPFNIASQGGVPTGYKSLCTANLPAVTITNPRKHFDVKTRAGNGSTTTVTGIGFQPDLVWVKNRNGVGASQWHQLVDAVRGVSKKLSSNATDAEGSYPSFSVTAFTSDGYTLVDTAAADYGVNGSTSSPTYVDWLWKANGVGVSNSAGSITSTVSANTTAGFSIVTYQMPTTGTSFTIGHGLVGVPELIIHKTRSTTSNWQVYHATTGASNGIFLNLTNASAAQSWWNSTAPTSTVFSVNNSFQGASPVDVTAYCFRGIAGFSKFGSYTGNGSTDGVYIHLGFRARYVLIKQTTVASATNWVVYDTARETENVMDYPLAPNLPDLESISGTNIFDITASGIKIRNSGAAINATSGTYIYAAFSEYPFGGSNIAPSPAR